MAESYNDPVALLRKFPEKTLRAELERAKSAGDRRHAANVEAALNSNGYGTTGIRTNMPGINYVREYLDTPYNTRAVFKPVVDPAFPDANFLDTYGFYGPGARGNFNRDLIQAQHNAEARARHEAIFGRTESVRVKNGEQVVVLKPGQRVFG